MTFDPRPLTTEPLALDLVNTEWVTDGEHHDLLESLAGMGNWLRSVGCGECPVDRAALEALRQARSAIRKSAEQHLDSATFGELDVVLSHGRLRVSASQSGWRELLEVDDERWRAPWLAVRNFLKLLSEHPGRLRACANPDCVLVFYDTSRNGARQWCSMAGCGNRAKARRHYARSRGS